MSPAVSIAPMMDRTDRHYRYLMRRITKYALLYSEMVTAAAVLHGDRDRLLSFDPCEHPLSLQLGGDDPDQLHRAVRAAAAYGYDEFNLNVGCPSDRVQEGSFGACLMADPARVRSIVEAMRAATDRPVTVKHRIGIDGRESYDEMREFVEIVREAGPARFTVHARIAVLAGLSPKENRVVPPLRYGDVYRLKRELPDLQVEINGQIASLDQMRRHLMHVDAVMVGRAAYEDPWFLRSVDRDLFGAADPLPTRRAVTADMADYIRAWQATGRPAHDVLRHMLGLFHGEPGSRRYRQLLSGPVDRGADGAALLERSVAHLSAEVLDR